METTNIVDFARRDGITDALTDLLRTGAQQLIATAVEAELEIQEIVMTYNLTPRKCLGYITPIQALFQNLGRDVRLTFA